MKIIHFEEHYSEISLFSGGKLNGGKHQLGQPEECSRTE